MAKSTPINWETFSINSREFIKAKERGTLSQLFHEYFSKNNVTNQPFISELSEEYPGVLVKAIRSNRAFLNPEHFSSFHLLKNHRNEYLRSHFQVFNSLAQSEKKLFEKFSESLQSLTANNIVEVFCWTGLWLEQKRAAKFQINSRIYYQIESSVLVESVEFFLSHYLFNNKDAVASVEIVEYQDFHILIEIVDKYKRGRQSQSIIGALNNAYNYISFLRSIIDNYSFDMNYEVSVDGAEILLKCIEYTPVKRWLVENEKIQFWYEHYRTIAKAMVDDKILLNPGFIKNTSGFDYQMNYDGSVKMTAARKCAYDFCIDESKLAGIPSSTIIVFLNSFVANASGRFVSPIDKLHDSEPAAWFENIFKCIADFGNRRIPETEQVIATGPIRLLHKSELKRIIKENIQNCEESEDQLIALVSNDIVHFSFINRNNVPINLTGKPFIKLGDYYIAFNRLLGEANSQVNGLINRWEGNFKLHQTVTQTETDEFERRVCKLFEDAGFDSICSVKYTGSAKGDFDIVVYNDGVMLIIELKRSKIRFNIADAHDEYENSLKKASGQLDKGVRYIHENFDKVKDDHFKKLAIKESLPSDIKIYPIVVSTSFGFDHVLIENKHLKISLFELQGLLEDEFTGYSANDLESFVFAISSDYYWKVRIGNAEMPDINSFTIRLM